MLVYIKTNDTNILLCVSKAGLACKHTITCGHLVAHTVKRLSYILCVPDEKSQNAVVGKAANLPLQYEINEAREQDSLLFKYRGNEKSNNCLNQKSHLESCVRHTTYSRCLLQSLHIKSFAYPKLHCNASYN